jgi:hypothetical protein
MRRRRTQFTTAKKRKPLSQVIRRPRTIRTMTCSLAVPTGIALVTRKSARGNPN